MNDSGVKCVKCLGLHLNMVLDRKFQFFGLRKMKYSSRYTYHLPHCLLNPRHPIGHIYTRPNWNRIFAIISLFSRKIVCYMSGKDKLIHCRLFLYRPSILIELIVQQNIHVLNVGNWHAGGLRHEPKCDFLPKQQYKYKELQKKFTLCERNTNWLY